MSEQMSSAKSEQKQLNVKPSFPDAFFSIEQSRKISDDIKKIINMPEYQSLVEFESFIINQSIINPFYSEKNDTVDKIQMNGARSYFMSQGAKTLINNRHLIVKEYEDFLSKTSEQKKNNEAK